MFFFFLFLFVFFCFVFFFPCWLAGLFFRLVNSSFYDLLKKLFSLQPMAAGRTDKSESFQCENIRYARHLLANLTSNLPGDLSHALKNSKQNVEVWLSNGCVRKVRREEGAHSVYLTHCIMFLLFHLRFTLSRQSFLKKSPTASFFPSWLVLRQVGHEKFRT